MSDTLDLAMIRRAISDPGAVLPRDRGTGDEPAESVSNWSARAVLAVLATQLEKQRAELLAELFDQAEDGGIPGTVIRHDGHEVWIHTTGQVTGWLHTLYEKAKGQDASEAA
jgi:hypothetical protein